MSSAIEIIDPEGERRQKTQRRILFLAGLVSFCLFAYPQGKDYYTKWKTMSAARKLALYLSMLKTKSILNKTALEARFLPPDKIEVYEVSNCGPVATRAKAWEAKLADFEASITFAPEPWVREHGGSREPFLPRFCYDPLYGSSVFNDGLAHGAIFLVHQTDLEQKRGDHLVDILVEGSSGDVEIE